MSNADGLTKLFADAYREAVLANIDMRAFAEALEPIRTRLSTGNMFEACDAIDEQIGNAQDNQLQKQLIGFRAAFESYHQTAEIERLAASFARDSEAGWTEWLRSYAESLKYWRIRFCYGITEAQLPFPAAVTSEIQRLRVLTRHALHYNWPEAYGLFEYFGNQELLPASHRAIAIVFAAQVQLYHFLKPEGMKALLRRAELLAPEETRIISAWGECALQESDFPEAERRFQEVIKRDPKMVEGYTLMGDWYERQNEVDAAEEWYREAVKNKSGDAQGYTRLMRLNGRPERLSAHESELMPLLARVIAVSSENETSQYLELGYIYQQNKRYPEAHAWFDKAIDLDPARSDGRIAKGYLLIEEEKYDQARTVLLTAIATEPDVFNGYWGMAWVCEQQQQWAEALKWYQESLPHRPVWQSITRGKIGEMLSNLERDAEAETELVQALLDDPTNETVVNLLTSLAERYYKTLSHPDAAIHVYDRIRELKGSDYEANYRNLIGNVKYYLGDYQAAAESYRQAIAADAQKHVFYSNLSLAWENIRVADNRAVELANAVGELRKARDLAPDVIDYVQRLAALELQQRMLTRYGEAALNLTPVNRITVGFAWDLLPFIVDGENLSADFQALIAEMRQRFKDRFGLDVPPINCKDVEEAQPGTYIHELTDIAMGWGQISADKKFYPGPATDLAALNLKTVEGFNPVDGSQGCWIVEADWPKVAAAGFQLWPIMEYPLRHLELLLQKYLAEFADHQETSFLLQAAAVQSEPPLEEITAFTKVLRALASEEVPVVALGQIYALFKSEREAGVDLTTIVERLRSLPEILPGLPGNNERSSLFGLGRELEDLIAGNLRQNPAGPVLAMQLQEVQPIMAEMKSVGTDPPSATAIVVDNAALRPFVRRLVDLLFPNFSVLSRPELLLPLRDKVRVKPEEPAINTSTSPAN
jgi:tetratricopeptide (TPR) repeat protein